MNFIEYKELAKIRLLMDERLPKAKQLLTKMLDQFEYKITKLNTRVIE